MTEPTGKKYVKSKAVELDMTSPWQKYANWVLIPIIIGLTAFLLYRFRMNAAENALAQERGDLTNVRMMLRDIRQADPTRTSSQEQLANFRDARYLDASRKIEELLASAKDPFIRAEAQVALGDLNWLIANFPQLPGATTRPALKGPKSTEDYLALAERAYKIVVTDYVEQRISAITARMGLASIAENRRNWDEAAKNYQIVADDTSAPEAFVTLAKQRLELLKTIKEPLFLGQVHAPTTQEIEKLSTTLPAVEAMTRPATPTTRP